VRDLTAKSGSGRKTAKMGSYLVVAFHKLMTTQFHSSCFIGCILHKQFLMDVRVFDVLQDLIQLQGGNGK
jgi:hypothetical protein